MQDSDYSCYDPLIVIDDQKLRFVGDDNPPMFKYLGMWIQSDLKEDIVMEKVEWNGSRRSTLPPLMGG